MSENQPSERERQQRLAEIQARLQRLTAERKAELEAEGSPSPASPASQQEPEGSMRADEQCSQEAAAPPPVPQTSAPTPPDPLPVLETPPPMEAAAPPSEPERPAWLTGTPAAEATPAEPIPAEPAAAEPTPAEPAAAEPLPAQSAAAEPPPAQPAAAEPPPAQPAAKAAPVARTRRPSAVSAAMSVLTARIAMLAGEAKRAAQVLGRQATAKAKALTSQRPPRRPQAPPRPEASAANDEPAERPAKKRPWLRAAVLVGVGLSGGIALMQFGDLELPEALDGALPAAERDAAGSQLANAAGSTELVETDAGPLPGQALAGGSAGQALAGGSAGDEGFGPAETALAEIQPAPPELEITTPSAPDVAALEVDLALVEPAASEPIPISSSTSPLATGDPTQRPTFIPYDVPPKLENPREIQKLLERGYPSQLRDAGVEGTVILWIFVDAQGAVQETEVKESSGYELMDKAALKTAEKMRFTPAMNRDKATPVWLAQPITFR